MHETLLNIDLKTFILVLGITHLMQVLVFYFQYKSNKNIKGPLWWLLWSAAESFGFILIILRNIPELLPIVILLQNIVLLLGTLFIYIGIMKFLRRKINRKFIIFFTILFLILHLSFIFIKDDIVIRSINIGFFLSLISLITAVNLFKYKPRSVVLTANFNAAIFIIHGFVFAYRTIMICFGAEVSHLFTPTIFNFLPYVDALVVSLLWTFGFIIMVNQRLNAEIAEARNHFEAIFSTSPDAAIISRISDGYFIDCNKSFTRISGYSKSDIFGKTTLDKNLWVDPDVRNEVIDIVEEKGICENYETLFRRKDGQVITGLISTQIFELNEIPHLISVIRDISDRKKQEEEIKIKNAELKKLNAEKDKFFSIIAHDLRSPFNSILGFSDILANQISELTSMEINEIVKMLQTNSQNVFKLLENLLEWSQLEQGSIKVNLKDFNVLESTNECLTTITDAAKSKNIVLNNDTPEELEIYSDKNIFQSILRNLITNAIKFTPKGGSVFISAFKENDQSVKYVVRDTGIGMNKLMLENLFKSDTHVRRKGTENETSTGLGLILCKGLIEKLGGNIIVESIEEKGTTITIIFPPYSQPADPT